MPTSSFTGPTTYRVKKIGTFAARQASRTRCASPQPPERRARCKRATFLGIVGRAENTGHVVLRVDHDERRALPNPGPLRPLPAWGRNLPPARGHLMLREGRI